MLDGIGSVCMSEVISANREAVVKSCLASRKRQRLRETCGLIHCSLDFPLSLFLSFSLSCFSPLLKCNLFFFPHFALFSFPAPMMRHRGDVMQVCSHECLSGNFTLYFSHVRGQRRAGIDWAFSINYKCLFVCKGMYTCGLVLCCQSSEEKMCKVGENSIQCKVKVYFELQIHTGLHKLYCIDSNYLIVTAFERHMEAAIFFL